jgi:hypothetical protein
MPPEGAVVRAIAAPTSDPPTDGGKPPVQAGRVADVDGVRTGGLARVTTEGF